MLSSHKIKLQIERQAISFVVFYIFLNQMIVKTQKTVPGSYIWTWHRSENIWFGKYKKANIIKNSSAYRYMHACFLLMVTAWVKYGVRSPKFIWLQVLSCTHWLRPCNPSPHPPFPPPAFGLIYEGTIGSPRI